MRGKCLEILFSVCVIHVMAERERDRLRRRLWWNEKLLQKSFVHVTCTHLHTLSASHCICDCNRCHFFFRLSPLALFPGLRFKMKEKKYVNSLLSTDETPVKLNPIPLIGLGSSCCCRNLSTLAILRIIVIFFCYWISEHSILYLWIFL